MWLFSTTVANSILGFRLKMFESSFYPTHVFNAIVAVSLEIELAIKEERRSRSGILRRYIS